MWASEAPQHLVSVRYSTGAEGGNQNHAERTPPRSGSLGHGVTTDDGYQLVDAPGPDVLRISAYLIDLVVKVPTEKTSGRQQSAASSYAEVTVVFELHDSESEEVMARVAERGDPTTTGGASNLTNVNPTFVRADLTRMFEYWAEILRKGMDKIHEAPLP